ncbi:PREDICTED: tRNA (cytosine(38)-C(5))-methyltransferase [Nicrophorus vespilloides]|uniref:tRNA (Cytosine(38)-C(5))-methyltransferase n=1 Tax=Nicrophorus vespilloides TaxID=110193 RepID=A0ABM1N5Z5_NICVS|nr:PREDICTED: tRNA (cytosine(38)-C(5))-methyltransferase [Nicrophorus vespilloides]
MKVLELYSGIGGMHLALQASKLPGEVIASVDINTVANHVYGYNFPETNLLNRNIQSLTPKFINSLEVDTILMSPPCQPFTRNGLQKDVDDARTCSFTHILQILPELKVKSILIENVKGFECSEMRERLIEALQAAGFNYQEFMLSPTQFGIPNTRHRYYCLASRCPDKFTCGPMMELFKYESFPKPFEIVDVLENGDVVEEYRLSEKVLNKRGNILDICYGHSTRSCCFTKAYGRYIEGTGSVYCPKSEAETAEVYNAESKDLLSLKMRFFTPREVCRLMAFPETFAFPASTTKKQMFNLLGNSVNVKVVSELIKVLI